MHTKRCIIIPLVHLVSMTMILITGAIVYVACMVKQSIHGLKWMNIGIALAADIASINKCEHIPLP